LRYINFHTTMDCHNYWYQRGVTLKNTQIENHNLINQIVKNDFCALAVFDRDLRYLSVSDQFLQDYQITRENIIGKSHYDIFPDIPERWKNAYNKALTGKTSSSADDFFVRKDGKRFINRWKTCPWYLSSGEVGGVILYTELISERKNLESKLQKEQELTALVLQTMGQGIVILDVDMVREYVNPAFCRMLGYQPGDLIGKKPVDITHPRYQAQLPLNRKNRAAGISEKLESALLNADGIYVPVLVTSTPRYEQGKVVGSISTIIDITERKKAELDIQKLSDEYERIFNGTQDAMFLLEVDENNEFRYLRNNKSHQENTGFLPEMLYGKTNKEVFGSEFGARLDANYQKCVDMRSPLVYEEELDFPAGLRIWRTSLTPIFEQDKINYIVGSSTDLTEQRLAEEEHKKLQEEFFQMQKMDSVGRLAGGIAHDFNNMLGVILGHTDLAIDILDLENPVAENLNEIKKAAYRSANIARQLLTFARKQPLQKKTVSLNPIISQTFDMLSRLTSEKIELDFVHNPNLWNIDCDPHQIEQILTNLTLNASDAISGNGIISITTENKVLKKRDPELQQSSPPGDFVMLSIKDSGSGIPETLLGQIFEPFFTTKAAGKGTGLGLSIVHGVVKQHEGFIQVQSKVAVGTEFRIYFPRSTEKKKNQLLTPVLDEQSRNSGTETILVVEDERAILQIIQTILTKYGYKIVAAAKPEDALAHVKKNPDAFDLLITDVIMPGMNGSELANKIRTHKKSIKCLYISGYTADIIAGVENGGSGVEINLLQKPFSASDLCTKVREILDS